MDIKDIFTICSSIIVSVGGSGITFGSHKRIKWKCKNGHTWSAVIKERTKQNGNKCPICRQSIR